MDPLPIDEHIDEIAAAVRTHRAAVVVAPPGAGKTTRVPPALLGQGPAVLLQPRRMAARSLARRIAAENGWTVGDQVGWQVRFERRFSRDTRLLVATEGVLTARLQSDPLLSGFRTVILDEFHERSLHADLALALARQAWEARTDLAVVVMSATLEAEPVSEFLGGCPIVEVASRPHPVEVTHAPGCPADVACLDALAGGRGHVLCFMPGAPEIRRLDGSLSGRLTQDVIAMPLHGSLSADAQDAALAPTGRRKLILATNIAETSLTVEGVDHVVDSGLHKITRRAPGLGIDRLETERISRDSAEQRAGRAGRTGPGRAVRLWDPRQELRPHREPEIRRVDLAAPLLQVLAWGADPFEFQWFERPDEGAAVEAMELLAELGAIDRDRRITRRGRALRRIPVHPRLARVLLGTGASSQAAAACAALAEGWTDLPSPRSTGSDLLLLADRVARAPARVRRAAEQLQRLAANIGAGRDDTAAMIFEPEPESLERAVFCAYADRLARRRGAGSDRLLLRNGHGAVLSRHSGVHDAEFLVAVEWTAGRRGAGSEALVRLASRVERQWIEPTDADVVHEIDPTSGVVRATERALHGRIVLSERTIQPDPESAAPLVVEFVMSTHREALETLQRRCDYADLGIEVRELVRDSSVGRTAGFVPDPGLLLPRPLHRELDRHAPLTLTVPSGRRVPLEYRADGTVCASVKLQELFGLAETPKVGKRGQPVTLSLLAPNGRPVQTTRDLRSFWTTAYAQVRKELRGRYPKHPWPENPWTAEPTARPKRRRR